MLRTTELFASRHGITSYTKNHPPIGSRPSLPRWPAIANAPGPTVREGKSCETLPCPIEISLRRSGLLRIRQLAVSNHSRLADFAIALRAHLVVENVNLTWVHCDGLIGVHP